MAISSLENMLWCISSNYLLWNEPEHQIETKIKVADLKETKRNQPTLAGFSRTRDPYGFFWTELDGDGGLPPLLRNQSSQTWKTRSDPKPKPMPTIRASIHTSELGETFTHEIERWTEKHRCSDTDCKNFLWGTDPNWVSFQKPSTQSARVLEQWRWCGGKGPSSHHHSHHMHLSLSFGFGWEKRVDYGGVWVRERKERVRERERAVNIISRYLS